MEEKLFSLRIDDYVISNQFSEFGSMNYQNNVEIWNLQAQKSGQILQVFFSIFFKNKEVFLPAS